MKTYLLKTLGCKVNQYESRQIQQLLEQIGLKPAAPGEYADIIIINTCCVTRVASSKSRQSIRHAIGNNPDARLIVTGCLPIGQENELNIPAEKCLIVKDKEHLPAILKKILFSHNTDCQTQTINKPLLSCKIKDKTEKPQHIVTFSPLEKTDPYNSIEKPNVLPLLKSYDGQCRAFLKVQDGCDAYCTYCIIPKIRTQVCNKDVNTIIQEARNLIAAGHKEIVLTGIFLGAYGQNTARRNHWNPEFRNSLAEMVAQVAALPGLARLRLSSLEPADVTDRLLAVFNSFPTLVPHLHLPLQSGSGRILKRMARQYTIEKYMDIISRVKFSLDRPSISTDIIVGFPGETDEDFEQTLDISRRVGFSKIHVFSYSLRKNTSAARLEPKVPSSIIRQRSKRLQTLDQQLQTKFRQQFIGKKVEVVVENTRPPKGRCERYFMVDLSHLPNAGTLKKGQLVNLILNK
jgi:threonylcarbamoyladenosine tRNA methylthiotransferase MtaB